MSDIEERLTFAIAEADDGGKVVLIGITKAAWDGMQDGRAKDADLSRLGVPLRLIIFGGDDHAAIMKILESTLGAAGITIDDRRRDDFSIQPVKRN